MSEEKIGNNVLKNLQHIEDDLRNGRYEVVFQESCKIFESIFKQLFEELFNKLDMLERMEVTRAMVKIDTKPYEKYTFGQLIRLFNDAKIFEKWKLKNNKDLGLISTINFFPIVDYRNDAAHTRVVSRADAELIHIYLVYFLAECGLLDLDSSRSLVREGEGGKPRTEAVSEYCSIFQEALVKILKEITDIGNQKDTEKLIAVLTAVSELCRQYNKKNAEDFSLKEIIDLDRKCHFFNQWYSLKYKKGCEDIIHTLEFSYIAGIQEKLLKGMDADYFEAELVKKYVVNFLAHLGFEGLVRKVVSDEGTLREYIKVQKAEVKGIRFVKSKISLTEGDIIHPEVVIFPEEAMNTGYRFTVEDEQDKLMVELLENNIIKAIKKGQCILTAVSNDNPLLRDNCLVSVQSEKIPVDRLTVTNLIELAVGEVKEIEVAILPENAGNRTVKWHIDDEDVAQLLSENRIKGLKAGKTTAIASCDDNPLIQDKCIVIVKAEPEDAEDLLENFDKYFKIVDVVPDNPAAGESGPEDKKADSPVKAGEKEYPDEVVILSDDEGNDREFEYLDAFRFRWKDYVALLPVGGDPNEVLILRVKNDEFLSIEDEKELNAVFKEFKKRAEKEFGKDLK